MRLLLINPRFPESWFSSKWALSELLPNKRAIQPRLGLTTLCLLQTRASVTLRVDAFQALQLDPFESLLRRLARYGDRVHIVIDERLRALVPIDSSVFNLVFARTAD